MAARALVIRKLENIVGDTVDGILPLEARCAVQEWSYKLFKDGQIAEECIGCLTLELIVQERAHCISPDVLSRKRDQPERH